MLDTKSQQTHSNTTCLKRYDEHVLDMENNEIGRYETNCSCHWISKKGLKIK